MDRAVTLSWLSRSGETTVTIDKEDYAPGETVVITGEGWAAGETVRLQVVHVGDAGDNTAPAHQPWHVTADADGNISSTWQVPSGEDEEGAVLKLTADGQTSSAHAEVIFTDLIGTLRLYVDAPGATSQTAYPWGATIHPQLTGGGSGICYRIQWRNPSNAAQQTNTFGPGATTYNPPTFAVPATGPSGTWSVVVDQNTEGNCAGPFVSPTNPILFDVARAVIVGAGRPGSTIRAAINACFSLRQTRPTNARARP